MGENEEKSKLHIAMYPWFAYGHMTPFLQLANKLAELGHQISFFLPPKPQLKLASLNRHPNLITFISVAIPAVDGLPDGCETTADAPMWAQGFLMSAMDLTQPTLDSSLSLLRPDLVFFDFAHWIPAVARKHGAKSVFYATTFVSFYAYMGPQAPVGPVEDLVRAPPGFPPPADALWYRAHEARGMAEAAGFLIPGVGISFPAKVCAAIGESDAVGFRSCTEMEGPYGGYFEECYKKPVLWAGPVLPELPAGVSDEVLDGWLMGFPAGSVVLCVLGSECVLGKEQFQELLLGLELTGSPFLVALKPPSGYETIETALPQGFLERTKERGIVKHGWIQQQLILKHPSIGCFITHCGASSLWEALVSQCQIVLLPQLMDQFMNARFMSGVLKVGVEVDKGDEDGFFTREAVFKAVQMVMEMENDTIAKEIRANHAKWRELLLREDFEKSCINDFVGNLRGLLG